MNKSSNFTVDSLSVNNEIFAPLVVCKNSSVIYSKKYYGFIPGFLMKNIYCDTVEEVLSQLTIILKDKIKEMLQNKEPFPFFPTEEEIYKDFKNVVKINFIKLISPSKKI